jgi:hypothetical protein
MDDFRVSIHSLPDLMSKLQTELETNPILVISIQPENTGKWGMARLWRMWMATTAEFMAKNGVTMPLMVNAEGVIYGTRPFNSDDAHELFTSRWLLVDGDGTRLSWSRKGRDGMRPATKGERFNALRQHEDWAADKGVLLFKPRGSEYEQVAKEQEQ